MEAKRAVSALGALAHEHRLATYRLLVEAGPNGLSAGVISERIGVPPSSLTFHLQQLLHSGLATQRRASRQVIYAADFTAMNSLVSYLTENCCGHGRETPGVCDPSCTPPIVSPPTGKAPHTRRKSA